MQRELDLNNIIDEVDERLKIDLKKEIKTFVSAFGKWFAFGLFGLLTIVISSNVYPIKEVAMVTILAVVFINGIILFGTFNYFNNKNNELKCYTVDMIKKLVVLVKDTTDQLNEAERRNEVIFADLITARDTASAYSVALADAVRIIVPRAKKSETARKLLDQLENKDRSDIIWRKK